MPPNPSEYFAGFHGPHNPFAGLYGGGVPTPRGPNLFGYNANQPTGSVEGAMQAAAPMIAEMLRSSLGIQGGAFMFGSDMNVASARYAADFLKQTMNARQQGAEGDTKQVEQIFRGLAVAMGHQFQPGTRDFDPQVSSAIRRLSSDASTMMPMLASMFPDTIDRLLPRGSMAVAASSFVNAGRFVIDPATGRPTSETANFARQVLEPFIDQGPKSTAGLGAGRLGQLYSELVDRGMVGSGQDLRKAAVERQAAVALFGEEAGAGVGMSGDRAREIQTDRIRKKLGDYSKTIAAINDIFAENGQSNAPMAELMQSLDTLTQGGFSVYSPEKLAGLTRTFQAAAQTSGLSLSGLTQLSATTGMMLNQYGGHRGMAAPIALYGAAAGMVFADRGFGMPSPEGMTREEYIGGIARNQAAFTGSSVGNMLGAISAAGRHVDANSDFGKIAAAVRKGETEITLASGEKIDLVNQLPRVHEIARQSGLGGALINQMMATGLNSAELVREQGIMKAGEKFQRRDLEQDLLTRLGGQFNVNQLRPLLDAVNEFSTQNGDVLSDVELAGLVGDRMKLDARQRTTLQSALSMTGERAGAKSGYTAWRMHSPEVQKQQAEAMRQLEARGVDQGKLTHLMRGGFMRNITGAIVRAASDGDFPMGLSFLRGLGFVSNEDVAGAFEGPGSGNFFGNLSDTWAGITGQHKQNAQTAGLGGAAAALGLGPKAPAKANTWRDGVGADAVADAPGFFGDVADKARKGAKAAGTPVSSAQNIKIEIAKLEIVGTRGTLNAQGSVRSAAPQG